MLVYDPVYVPIWRSENKDGIPHKGGKKLEQPRACRLGIEGLAERRRLHYMGDLRHEFGDRTLSLPHDGGPVRDLDRIEVESDKAFNASLARRLAWEAANPEAAKKAKERATAKLGEDDEPDGPDSSDAEVMSAQDSTMRGDSAFDTCETKDGIIDLDDYEDEDELDQDDRGEGPSK